MSIIILLLPLVLIFFMMQSQRKKAAAQQQLLKALTEGDDVMTTAGIYGTITWIGQEEAFIEIAEGVEIHVAKASIARKVDMTTTEAARASDGDGAVETSTSQSSLSGSTSIGPIVEGAPPVDGLPVDEPTAAEVDDVSPPVAQPKRRRGGRT